MTQIANPRKVFNFRVEIDGFDQFAAQKVTLPEIELTTTSHGDTNHDVKTAGRATVGDLVIEKLKPLPGADNWAWEWLKLAHNFDTGGGSLPEQYKKVIVIKELSTDGRTTVNRWVYKGAFVKKLSQSDFDRNSSDNVIQTVTISVDKPDYQ